MRPPKAGADLHEAARITRRNPIGTSRRNVSQLRSENGVGRRRLEQIVDAGSTAALLGVRERYAA